MDIWKQYQYRQNILKTNKIKITLKNKFMLNIFQIDQVAVIRKQMCIHREASFYVYWGINTQLLHCKNQLSTVFVLNYYK